MHKTEKNNLHMNDTQHIQVSNCDSSVQLPHAPYRYVLKGFSQEGRDLTDDETKAFLKAADKDGDGKIGIDGA